MTVSLVLAGDYIPFIFLYVSSSFQLFFACLNLGFLVPSQTIQANLEHFKGSLLALEYCKRLDNPAT